MKEESRVCRLPVWSISTFVFIVLQWQVSNAFVVLPGHHDRTASSGATMTKAATLDSDTQKMLDRAQQLREEANAMESQLREERGTTTAAERLAPEPVEKAVKYQEVPGSTWAITYRFAEEPVKDRDEDAEPLEFFRGTFSILLRPDGYTEIVGDNSDNSNGVKVVKIWGWDEELSQEDGKKYVLFSMDAKTPSNPKQKQRFYFQASLENESANAICLKEGTVTIKQDLAETKKIMGMGFFSAAGILAQFRYVGDFVAKPIQIDN